MHPESKQRSLSKSLSKAIALHKVGRLSEAEKLYRAFLAIQPRHPDANHNLGVLAVQAGRPGIALPYFRLATQAAPGQAIFWRSYIGALVDEEQLVEARAALDEGGRSALSPGEAAELDDRLRRAEAAERLFDAAVSKHQAGHLEAAEAGYAQVLAIRPEHAKALSNRGFALLTLGRAAEAEASCRRALELRPRFADAATNLGNAQSRLGRHEDAVASFRRALELSPANQNAHFNLANTLAALGRFDEAIEMYAATLRLRPDHAEAMINLAGVCRTLGRFDEAIAHYTRALAIDPENPLARCNLGSTRQALGQYAEAEAEYRRCLAFEPNSVLAHIGLGGSLLLQRRTDEAETSLRRALEVDPGNISALGNLGAVFCEAKRLKDAEDCFLKCLEREPGNAIFLSNYGAVLFNLDRLEESETSIRRALEIDPDFADAHFNLANTLQKFGRLEESETNFRRATALKPGYVAAHNNFGNTLRDLGRLEEAAASFRRVVELEPDHIMAECNQANALRELGRIEDAYAILEDATRRRPDYLIGRKNLLTVLMYHPGIDPERHFAVHRRFEAELAEPNYGALPPAANDASPDRRLRVGYMSSDFRTHSAARNLLPLLRCHDRERFEIHLYAEIARPDSVTDAFRAVADGWHPTVGLGDREVAEQMRSDGIDILVSLAGRFDLNRPLVPSFRPAPVQISSHDVATSGLKAMDYLIADRSMVPRNGREHFAERVLCVPQFYLAEVPRDLPPVHARAGEGPVVFGCLNNPAKATEAVLDLWARVLAAVPGSRLLLRYINWYEAPSIRARVAAAMAHHGVEASRVDYPPPARSHREHLSQYDTIDVALDTFPFAGSTTTFDALLMGVPVVTLPGWSMVSRWSAAMLKGLGLEDLIAWDEQAYVRIAADLAGNPARRAELRATLRARISASPLCDAAGRARQYERLYRAVWRRWCASKWAAAR